MIKLTIGSNSVAELAVFKDQLQEAVGRSIVWIHEEDSWFREDTQNKQEPFSMTFYIDKEGIADAFTLEQALHIEPKLQDVAQERLLDAIFMLFPYQTGKDLLNMPVKELAQKLTSQHLLATKGMGPERLRKVNDWFQRLGFPLRT